MAGMRTQPPAKAGEGAWNSWSTDNAAAHAPKKLSPRVGLPRVSRV